MINITDVAKVIRSKNCSPFELTMDIIFKDAQDYYKLKESQAITKEVIADLYRIPVARVQKVIWFEPAYAVKVTMARSKPAGVPGDSDVYGAQQHAPLLNLQFDL